MNAPLHAGTAHAIAEAVASACARIAPSWPLDRHIAVNPHWGWIDQPIEDAAAALGVLAGMRLLPEAAVQRQPLIADLAGLREAVVHQISQHCAAHFDDGQARWHMPTEPGLYGSWLARLAADRGLRWPQGRGAALAQIASLPVDASTAIEQAVRALGIPPAGVQACLTAWLLDLNGWAAACAWQGWQARLAGQAHPALQDLLAIRAGWDLLLASALPAPQVQAWAEAWGRTEAAAVALRARHDAGWERLQSEEQALQAQWMAGMARGAAVPPAGAVGVQAVFCIDVRSEVLRRALEAADPAIATRGFAGFFGLPADYRPLGSDWRQPQLPGLLAPALTIEEGAGEASLAQVLGARRRSRLAAAARWEAWRATPAAGFSFVESCGVLQAGALLRHSLPAPRTSSWTQAGLTAEERRALRPRLALDAEAAADLAAGVLRAMGLVSGFAPLVLLCGHGGQSANNPHAAGLDCGACGGQSGEVNARALASLLNDREVRQALRRRGVDLPDTTHVLAGLHNTTTDEVTLFDLQDLPAGHAAALARLQRALARAGDAARAERAPRLGLPALAPPVLLARLRERAAHWAETRPEWALADNSAFIAAPRSRTLGLHLGGRVFLHDYDERLDPEHQVLALILSAPMVVAHWINLQYLASTVDPQRQGAGNKLLHNVVGGGVGVFEGNGGDLRIGLPWQSVHDGRTLRHTPLRLSVFVQAGRAAIDAVIGANDTVRCLVDNGWLHLLAIEGQATPTFARRLRGGGWETVALQPTGSASSPAADAAELSARKVGRANR
ncbi:putative inorganic carbon transporter subunit DabA [Aquabacterium sp.]|uniref:putative inorganic carbon transporter subunit DabA n=1 Tax=Aquabacterium sp. TaxID=1872578 RepID=UPI003783F002